MFVSVKMNTIIPLFNELADLGMNPNDTPSSRAFAHAVMTCTQNCMIVAERELEALIESNGENFSMPCEEWEGPARIVLDFICNYHGYLYKHDLGNRVPIRKIDLLYMLYLLCIRCLHRGQLLKDDDIYSTTAAGDLPVCKSCKLAISKVK